MKTMVKMILCLSVVVMIGCEKNNESLIDESDKLIGYWSNPVAVDTLWKYERVNSFNENDYGFSFKPGQVFEERKNSGDCGTPPISYSNYDGTWTKNGTFLNITVGYWGGTADYQWKIISVDNDNLLVYKIKEVYKLPN